MTPHTPMPPRLAGTSVASSSTLLDVPVALATFYADATSTPPRIPAVAVAAGTFVFIYRNLRPYMKFTCPEVRGEVGVR